MKKHHLSFWRINHSIIESKTIIFSVFFRYVSFLPINGSVNAQKYQDLLQNIFPEILHHFPYFVFMQDNAPAHSARSTIDFIHSFGITILKWPAKSPDLNPIEHLWSYIKRQIKGMTFENLDELFNTISEVWENIPDDLIMKYYDSFKGRCMVCRDINGDSLNANWVKVRRYVNGYKH